MKPILYMPNIGLSVSECTYKADYIIHTLFKGNLTEAQIG